MGSSRRFESPTGFRFSLAGAVALVLTTHGFCVLPQVNYLGEVISKDSDAGTLAIHASRFTWFPWFGEPESWQECDFELQAAAPSSSALSELAAGDVVEVSSFGAPGECGDTWIVVAKLRSLQEAFCTAAYGDVGYLLTPLSGNYRIAFHCRANCEACYFCPEEVPYLCESASVDISLSQEGNSLATTQLVPGETWWHSLREAVLQVTFHQGECFAAPHCTEIRECVGRQLVSSFTLRLLPPGTLFTRGDANADSRFNIADAVCILSHLFRNEGGPCPEAVRSCEDAADANDDGKIDIADGVAALGALFGRQPSLPGPFYTCGLDPTGDTLGCDSFAPCP